MGSNGRRYRTWFSYWRVVEESLSHATRGGTNPRDVSPNDDFLWTQRDAVKNAWIFDAPYLVLQTSRGKTVNGETNVFIADWLD